MDRLSTVIEVTSSNPVNVPCFFRLIFFLFIYLFIDIIHDHFQTNLIAEYRFNDCKQCMPYCLVDAFSGISHMRFRVFSHLDHHKQKQRGQSFSQQVSTRHH